MKRKLLGGALCLALLCADLSSLGTTVFAAEAAAYTYETPDAQNIGGGV